MSIRKRDWNSFLPKMRKNLGFFFFTGVGITVLFFGFNIDLYQFYVIVFAIFLIILGLALVVYMSWPNRIIKTADKLGENIDLSTVKKLRPPVLKIGIVGLSSVGKTTLTENIIQTNYTNERTLHTSVIICNNRLRPNEYFGMIDGPGNNTPEQFNIIQNSDILVILFDHNSSEDRIPINDDRLREISNLNNQFRNLFNQYDLKLNQIHLVLNKKDLWIKESEENIERLEKWFEKEITRWDTGSFAKFVSSSHHSNKISKDLNLLISKLKI